MGVLLRNAWRFSSSSSLDNLTTFMSACRHFRQYSRRRNSTFSCPCNGELCTYTQSSNPKNAFTSNARPMKDWSHSAHRAFLPSTLARTSIGKSWSRISRAASLGSPSVPSGTRYWTAAVASSWSINAGMDVQAPGLSMRVWTCKRQCCALVSS